MIARGTASASTLGTQAPEGLRCCVVDWVACGLGRRDKADWRAWAEGRAGPDPVLAAPVLPTLLRRRVTAVGQAAFAAACGISDLAGARFIFCSRHGEFRRTKRLLDMLAAGEALSPAEFSLSVHNALAGLLSIEQGNGAGHTALAAGIDSFGSGLLEAAACIASGEEEKVLLVYFDEPLPEEYGAFGAEQGSLALAVALAPARGNGADMIVSFEPLAPNRGRSAGLSATGQALDFIRFLLSSDGDGGSAGERVHWRWRRAAP